MVRIFLKKIVNENKVKGKGVCGVPKPAPGWYMTHIPRQRWAGGGA